MDRNKRTLLYSFPIFLLFHKGDISEGSSHFELSSIKGPCLYPKKDTVERDTKLFENDTLFGGVLESRIFVAGK